jgi:murein DD-endopeptidase MepM/ murein hydrolase activator NlpD
MNTLDVLHRAFPLANTAGAQAPAPGSEQVEALAQEFESMLLTQVMRQVRQTMASWGDEPESGDVLGGNTDALNDTIDGELARYLAKTGGFGLSSFLANSLSKSPVFAAGPSAPATASGQAPANATAQPSTTLTPATATPAPPSAPASSVPQTPVGVSPDGRGAAQDAAPIATDDAAPVSDASQAPAMPSGVITSPFGWRVDPLQHTPRFHNGIDIRAAYGQPVPAAADGRVVVAREQGGYGLTVVVQHANGFQTRYAHLSALSVTEGETVSEQQTVGLAGRSGRATGPHVHFEVTRAGQRLDPSAVVQTRAFKKTVARADFRSGEWSPSPATPPE